MQQYSHGQIKKAVEDVETRHMDGYLFQEPVSERSRTRGRSHSGDRSRSRKCSCRSHGSNRSRSKNRSCRSHNNNLSLIHI